MSRFRAIYVPLIFLFVLWIPVPAALFWFKIKPLNEEWKKTFDARNTSRGAYGSLIDFTGLWPPEGQESSAEQPKKFEEGAKDYAQDKAAAEKRKAEKTEELAAKKVDLAQHQAQLDATLRRYMADINRDRFDWNKPDLFGYELLRLQRDEEGPRLIRFLDRAYPKLFFDYDITLPPPNINSPLPPTGPWGRVEWPVGKGPINFTVWGLYDDLLNFVETFPERYSRVAQIRNFTLRRVAFDHRGRVLMEMNVSVQLYVWPNNAPSGGAGAAPAGGAPGMDPGMAPPGDPGAPPADPAGAPPPPPAP